MSLPFTSVAVTGVLLTEGRLLVIRRSEHVVAPGKICFPGGTVENGESLKQALVREFREELAMTVEPVREVYQSVTPWKCKVHWWEVKCQDPEKMTLNEQEVSSAFFSSAIDLLAEPDLLVSNHHFLTAVDSGEISLGGV